MIDLSLYSDITSAQASASKEGNEIICLGNVLSTDIETNIVSVSSNSVTVIGNHTGVNNRFAVMGNEIVFITATTPSGANTTFTIERAKYGTKSQSNSFYTNLFFRTVSIHTKLKRYEYSTHSNSKTDAFPFVLETGIAEFYDWNSNYKVRTGRTAVYIFKGFYDEVILKYVGFTFDKKTFEPSFNRAGYTSLKFNDKFIKWYEKEIRDELFFKSVYPKQFLTELLNYNTNLIRYKNGNIETDFNKTNYLFSREYNSYGDILKAFSNNGIRFYFDELERINITTDIISSNLTLSTVVPVTDTNLISIEVSEEDQFIVNDLKGEYFDRTALYNFAEFDNKHVRYRFTKAISSFTLLTDVVGNDLKTFNLLEFTDATVSKRLQQEDIVILKENTGDKLEIHGKVMEVFENGKVTIALGNWDKDSRLNEFGRIEKLQANYSTAKNWTLHYVRDQLPIVYKHSSEFGGDNISSHMMIPLRPKRGSQLNILETNASFGALTDLETGQFTGFFEEIEGIYGTHTGANLLYNKEIEQYDGAKPPIFLLTNRITTAIGRGNNAYVKYDTFDNSQITVAVNAPKDKSSTANILFQNEMTVTEGEIITLEQTTDISKTTGSFTFEVSNAKYNLMSVGDVVALKTPTGSLTPEESLEFYNNKDTNWVVTSLFEDGGKFYFTLNGTIKNTFDFEVYPSTKIVYLQEFYILGNPIIQNLSPFNQQNSTSIDEYNRQEYTLDGKLLDFIGIQRMVDYFSRGYNGINSKKYVLPLNIRNKIELQKYDIITITGDYVGLPAETKWLILGETTRDFASGNQSEYWVVNLNDFDSSEAFVNFNKLLKYRPVLDDPNYNHQGNEGFVNEEILDLSDYNVVSAQDTKYGYVALKPIPESILVAKVSAFDGQANQPTSGETISVNNIAGSKVVFSETWLGKIGEYRVIRIGSEYILCIVSGASTGVVDFKIIKRQLARSEANLISLGMQVSFSEIISINIDGALTTQSVNVGRADSFMKFTEGEGMQVQSQNVLIQTLSGSNVENLIQFQNNEGKIEIAKTGSQGIFSVGNVTSDDDFIKYTTGDGLTLKGNVDISGGSINISTNGSEIKFDANNSYIKLNKTGSASNNALLEINQSTDNNYFLFGKSSTIIKSDSITMNGGLISLTSDNNSIVLRNDTDNSHIKLNDEKIIIDKDNFIVRNTKISPTQFISFSLAGSLNIQSDNIAMNGGSIQLNGDLVTIQNTNNILSFTTDNKSSIKLNKSGTHYQQQLGNDISDTSGVYDGFFVGNPDLSTNKFIKFDMAEGNFEFGEEVNIQGRVISGDNLKVDANGVFELGTTSNDNYLTWGSESLAIKSGSIEMLGGSITLATIGGVVNSIYLTNANNDSHLRFNNNQVQLGKVTELTGKADFTGIFLGDKILANNKYLYYDVAGDLEIKTNKGFIGSNTTYFDITNGELFVGSSEVNSNIFQVGLTTGNYIGFDETNLNIKSSTVDISGGLISFASGLNVISLSSTTGSNITLDNNSTFKIGDANQYVNWVSGALSIKATNVDISGNITMTGGSIDISSDDSHLSFSEGANASFIRLNTNRIRIGKDAIGTGQDGLWLRDNIITPTSEFKFDILNNKLTIKTNDINITGGEINLQAGTDQIKLTNVVDESIINLAGGSVRLDNAGILAKAGTIGGWILEENLLKSQVTGARIELNKAKNRTSVFDAVNEKVAMGYLEGLPKNDGTGNWGAGDYGFWAREGDKLRIDGDGEYINGDWIIKNDASYLIEDASLNTIVRLGTDSGEKGVFIYNTSGVKLAEYSSSRIYVGSVTQYLEYDNTLGTLKVKGNLEILSATGYDNITGIPTSLSDVNSTEGTKLGGIETGATNNSAKVHYAYLKVGADALGLGQNGFYVSTNGQVKLENTNNELYFGTTTTKSYLDLAKGGNGRFQVGATSSSQYLKYEDGTLTINGNVNIVSGTGFNRVFRQDNAPTGTLNTGDVWIDTNDNDKLYTYTGSVWVLSQDSATAQTTADGKNTIFRSISTSTPVALKIGDMWVQTDTDDVYTATTTGTGGWVISATNNKTKVNYSEVSIGENAVATGKHGFKVTTDGWVDINNTNNAIYFDKDSGANSYIRLATNGVNGEFTVGNTSLDEYIQWKDGALKIRGEIDIISGTGFTKSFLSTTKPTTFNEGDIWINPQNEEEIWRANADSTVDTGYGVEGYGEVPYGDHWQLVGTNNSRSITYTTLKMGEASVLDKYGLFREGFNVSTNGYARITNSNNELYFTPNSNSVDYSLLELDKNGTFGKFSVGNTSGSRYINYQNGQLTIAGNITITGGSGIASLSDAGALAVANDLDDVTDGSVHKKTTLNEKTGAGRAFAGLDINSALTTSVLPNSPIGTPSSNGLYLGSDYLGYYDTVWTSYIKSDGNFAFTGDDNNKIVWDGSTFLVKSDTIEMNGGSITLSATDSVDVTNGDNKLLMSTTTTNSALRFSTDIQLGRVLGVSGNTNYFGLYIGEGLTIVNSSKNFLYFNPSVTNGDLRISSQSITMKGGEITLATTSNVSEIKLTNANDTSYISLNSQKIILGYGIDTNKTGLYIANHATWGTATAGLRFNTTDNILDIKSNNITMTGGSISLEGKNVNIKTTGSNNEINFTSTSGEIMLGKNGTGGKFTAGNSANANYFGWVDNNLTIKSNAITMTGGSISLGTANNQILLSPTANASFIKLNDGKVNIGKDANGTGQDGLYVADHATWGSANNGIRVNVTTGNLDIQSEGTVKISNESNELYFDSATTTNSHIKMNTGRQQIGKCVDTVDTLGYSGFFFGDTTIANKNFFKYNQDNNSSLFAGKYFNETAYVYTPAEFISALDITKTWDGFGLVEGVNENKFAFVNAHGLKIKKIVLMANIDIAGMFSFHFGTTPMGYLVPNSDIDEITTLEGTSITLTMNTFGFALDSAITISNLSIIDAGSTSLIGSHSYAIYIDSQGIYLDNLRFANIKKRIGGTARRLQQGFENIIVESYDAGIGQLFFNCNNMYNITISVNTSFTTPADSYFFYGCWKVENVWGVTNNTNTYYAVQWFYLCIQCSNIFINFVKSRRLFVDCNLINNVYMGFSSDLTAENSEHLIYRGRMFSNIYVANPNFYNKYFDETEYLNNIRTTVNANHNNDVSKFDPNTVSWTDPL